MSVLTLLLFLLQVSAGSTNAPCDRLFEVSTELAVTLSGDELGSRASVLRQRFAETARRSRMCYAELAPSPERLRRIKLLYRRELWALRHELRFRRLREICREALASSYAGEDDEWRGYMLRECGAANSHLGFFTEAYGDYSRALQLIPQANIESRFWLHGELVELALRTVDLEAASLHASATAVLFDELETPTSIHEAYALYLQAQVDERSTDPSNRARALDKALQATELYRQSQAPENAASAAILAADLAAELGETARSRALLEEAVTLGEAAASDLTLASALLRLGHLEAERNDWVQADATFAKALEHARATNYFEHLFLSTFRLGLVSLAQGDVTDATLWLRRAIQHSEAFRASANATNWSVATYAHWQRAHRVLVRVLLKQGRTQEAFELLEQTRARYLRDLLVQSQISADLPVAVQTMADSLTDALAEVRNKRASATRSLDITLHRSEAELTASLASLLDVDLPRQVPSVDAMQRTLQARGQVLLSYFLHAGEAAYGLTASSHVFVLTPKALTAIDLPESPDAISELIASISPVFRDLSPGSSTATVQAQQFNVDALFALYQATVAPVRPHLPAQGRIAVVPDGPLFTVPFGMLLEAPVPPYAFRDAPFLVHRYAFSSELAASLVAYEPPTAPPARTEVLAAGRSTFRDEQNFDIPFPDLPAVASELDVITSLFADSHMLLDNEARESDVVRGLSEAEVVHIASHAVVSARPLYSAILLAPDDSSDGTLYVHELHRRPLGATLIVLSGCRTGSGIVATGEGMRSLQSAFHAAGVQSSVATLWLVEDGAIARLMRRFYEALGNGAPKDLALQQAQLAFLATETPILQSPFFWAAPVLYGNPTAIDLTKNPRLPMRVGVGGTLVLAFLLAYLLIRTRRRSHA